MKSGGELKRGAMPRVPRYHPDFDLDVLDAAKWYATRSRSLAVDFTLKVEHAVAEILDDPERRCDVDYGLKYWPVERFPHVVFFDFTDTEVLFIGVMHPSQSAGRWVARNG